jgi:hypothetical protein
MKTLLTVQPVIRQPLVFLGLSDSFTITAVANGVMTLDDFVHKPLTELARLEWFTPDVFQEIAWLLKNLNEGDN